MESAGIVEERLGVLDCGAAEGSCSAALVNGLQELGGQLAVGLFPGLIIGDDVGPEDAAALASLSMS